MGTCVCGDDHDIGHPGSHHSSRSDHDVVVLDAGSYHSDGSHHSGGLNQEVVIM